MFYSASTVTKIRKNLKTVIFKFENTICISLPRIADIHLFRYNFAIVSLSMVVDFVYVQLIHFLIEQLLPHVMLIVLSIKNKIKVLQMLQSIYNQYKIVNKTY